MDKGQVNSNFKGMIEYWKLLITLREGYGKDTVKVNSFKKDSIEYLTKNAPEFEYLTKEHLVIKIINQLKDSEIYEEEMSLDDMISDTEEKIRLYVQHFDPE